MSRPKIQDQIKKDLHDKIGRMKQKIKHQAQQISKLKSQLAQETETKKLNYDAYMELKEKFKELACQYCLIIGFD